MSKPDNEQKPDENQPEGNKPEGEKNSDGSNKSSSSSPLVYLLLAGIVLAIVLTTLGSGFDGKKIVLSEFIEGVKSGEYNKSNVHDLIIGTDKIKFADQPRKKSSEDSEEEENESEQPKEGDPIEQNTAEQNSDEDSEKTEARKRFYIPISSMPDEDKKAIRELLMAHGIGYEYAPPPSALMVFLHYLPFLLLPLIILYILIFKMNGPGSAMAFGRSRGKLYAQEDVNTTFENVAGIDEAVEELREIVEFLKTPEKYQALGGRIPHGVLLVGPPGTGKTLLAKAVAGEAGVPFFGLSGSDFVEMYVGVGAARVRDMFSQAVQRAPSIIFIDELDALGRARGSGPQGGHDEREQTLNALLVEMDGFSSEQSVIVMGATNRPETLDPALMRPGRFDRHVLVDKADYKGREQILKVHAEKIKMDDSVNFNEIAKMTPGFSGADLANLVNEAALLAARNNKKAVTKVEFEEAIERVIAGLEKSTRIISPDEKRRVAYHECGHALVALSLPNTDPVHKISIIPRGFGALGYMLQRPQDDRHLTTKTELEHQIAILLGGTATEQLVFEETSTGASNDLERATDIAQRMVTQFGMSPKMGRVNYQTSSRSPFLGNIPTGSDHVHSEATIREIDLEVKRIIDELLETVLEILSSRREVLEHMAKDLIEMEVMDADHLQSILDQYKKGPQLKPGTFVDKTTAAQSEEANSKETPRLNEGS